MSEPTQKTFYVTSPIFYPNGELHIGHAYVMIVCDILARYHRLVGNPTYFLTGSDENSTKIIKKTAELGKTVPVFLDEMSASFKLLFKDIEASYDQFIRTKDEAVHWPGATALWNALVAKGDIYKSSYKGLYCVECETFYTEKDLVDGKCPYHFIAPEVIEEENYFFKLASYSEKIITAIESGEMNVIPESRKNEILSVLRSGLQDVSFSRPTKTEGQGIPVPGDASQTIYVWCDALANYITALGYGTSHDELFKQFWPASVHVVGKDILRFHAAIWPAMLLSAGLPLPKNILVHGLLMSGGKKMSKSLGNSINPHELLNQYGGEAMRYYFARHVPLFDDGELNHEVYKDVYNANLANGLGNLTSRILKMTSSYGVEYKTYTVDALLSATPARYVDMVSAWKSAFEAFDINSAANVIWKKIGDMDKKIQETEPFKLIKTDEVAAKAVLTELAEDLGVIACLVVPILPTSAALVSKALEARAMPEAPLFLRK